LVSIKELYYDARPTKSQSFFQVTGFLDAFAKFQGRLLASSYLSFLPSVRIENLGSHWTDFYKI